VLLIAMSLSLRRAAMPATYAAPAAYAAAPVTYAAPTAYAAPMTYGAPVAEIDRVVGGRVVERDFIGGGMTYAAPAVSYGAPAVTYAAPTTYAAPMTYGAPVAEIDRVVGGRVVERDFIGGGMTYAAPAVSSGAPAVTYAAPMAYAAPMTYGAPVAEVDRVVGGRVVERDFIGGGMTYAAPAVSYGAPAVTYAAPRTYAAPMTYGAPVAEIDRVVGGRVVERDFIGGGMTYAAPAVSYGAPAVTYAAPTTYAAPMTYGAPVAEIDRVVGGRVVERDFIGGGMTYAAPAVSYGAPAVTYAAPTTYAAPITYGSISRR
jgi:hypothetical protein